jgi:hypothetical protein
MQKIILERLHDGHLVVGRVYVDGKKTSAYIVPSISNEYLFSDKQLNEIRNEESSEMF